LAAKTRFPVLEITSFPISFPEVSSVQAMHAKMEIFPDFLPRNTRSTRRRSEALARQARKGI
jgi:hypothetical protein